MAPNGNFYPCRYQEHLHVADDLLRDYCGAIGGGDSEEDLISKGWIAIHLLTFLDHGYLFIFRGHLTELQIRTIKPVVEDNMDRIIKSNRTELLYEFER